MSLTPGSTTWAAGLRTTTAYGQRQPLGGVCIARRAAALRPDASSSVASKSSSTPLRRRRLRPQAPGDLDELHRSAASGSCAYDAAEVSSSRRSTLRYHVRDLFDGDRADPDRRPGSRRNTEGSRTQSREAAARRRRKPSEQAQTRRSRASSSLLFRLRGARASARVVATGRQKSTGSRHRYRYPSATQSTGREGGSGRPSPEDLLAAALGPSEEGGRRPDLRTTAPVTSVSSNTPLPCPAAAASPGKTFARSAWVRHG